jgi:hypothetical protein
LEFAVKGKKTVLVCLVFLFFFLLAWMGPSLGLGQQKADQTLSVEQQEEIVPEKIVGAPQDAKQKTGIWVFVAWMWISVFVLIFLLRLKIKEVDRLYRLRFFSAKKN